VSCSKKHRDPSPSKRGRKKKKTEKGPLATGRGKTGYSGEPIDRKGGKVEELEDEKRRLAGAQEAVSSAGMKPYVLGGIRTRPSPSNRSGKEGNARVAGSIGFSGRMPRETGERNGKAARGP